MTWQWLRMTWVSKKLRHDIDISTDVADPIPVFELMMKEQCNL